MNSGKVLLSLVPLLLVCGAFADSPGDIARGNMHFDAAAMDSNGDGMISKEEMQKYGESMWEKLAHNETRTLPIAEAAQDFARGNLRFSAPKMDVDGDGTISKEEFMNYAMAKFDTMKKDTAGQVSVADMAKAFGRGNTNPDKKPAASGSK